MPRDKSFYPMRSVRIYKIVIISYHEKTKIYYFFPFFGVDCTPAKIESKVFDGSCTLIGLADLAPLGAIPGGRGSASSPKLKLRERLFSAGLRFCSVADRTGARAGLRLGFM
jgi:hypothetical protein